MPDGHQQCFAIPGIVREAPFFEKCLLVIVITITSYFGPRQGARMYIFPTTFIFKNIGIGWVGTNMTRMHIRISLPLLVPRPGLMMCIWLTDPSDAPR